MPPPVRIAVVATSHVLIVCTDAVRAQMEASLATVDPDSVGPVMTSPVAFTATPTVVVGWCTVWGMDADQRRRLLTAYGQQGWRPLLGTEGDIMTPGAVVPPWPAQRFWMFDADAWPVPSALASLGLVTQDQGRE